MDRDAFLTDYRLSPSDLSAAGCTWEELAEIRDRYVRTLEDRNAASELIARLLRRERCVHSVRIRVKDANHLLEKVIRKRKSDPSRVITAETYDSEITDLIGLRVLHLYKADWANVHRHLTSIFDLVETPHAYVREGDPIDPFEAEGCAVAVHSAGYRSVHYIVQQQIGKVVHRAEIQVRTLFEEGWSEVDHDLRYPYFTDVPLVAEFLLVFNRLAGSADEMGSFIRRLCTELRETRERLDGLATEKSKLETERQKFETQVSELKASIQKLGREVQERDKALGQLEALQHAFTVSTGLAQRAREAAVQLEESAAASGIRGGFRGTVVSGPPFGVSAVGLQPTIPAGRPIAGRVTAPGPVRPFAVNASKGAPPSPPPSDVPRFTTGDPAALRRSTDAAGTGGPAKEKK